MRMSTAGLAVAEGSGVAVAVGVGVGVGVAVAAPEPAPGTPISALLSSMFAPLTEVTTMPSSVTLAGSRRGLDAADPTVQVIAMAATATTAMMTTASDAARMRRTRDCFA